MPLQRLEYTLHLENSQVYIGFAYCRVTKTLERAGRKVAGKVVLGVMRGQRQLDTVQTWGIFG